MNDSQATLVSLREELDRWEELLATLSQDALTAPLPASHWSIKDVLAHLWAWQQASVARLEAAQRDREPNYPVWFAGLHPDAEEHLEQYNATIYEAHRQLPWSQVYQQWRAGFLRLLSLAETISDDDLLHRHRYPWLQGYPLLAVLEGTLEHHQEHRPSVSATSGPPPSQISGGEGAA